MEEEYLDSVSCNAGESSGNNDVVVAYLKINNVQFATRGGVKVDKIIYRENLIRRVVHGDYSTIINAKNVLLDGKCIVIRYPEGDKWLTIKEYVDMGCIK